ncbi:MAG TPA: UDP-3-O-(3-hydroxymyristoyl)glucosamine N-acyltransferase [Alphaproteobacteria bacterium]
MSDPRFFKSPKPQSLAALAQLSGAEVKNCPNAASFFVDDVAPLQMAQSNHLSFFDNKKYLDTFLQSQAGACFIAPDQVDKAPAGMALLVSKNPYKSYALAAQQLYPEPSWSKAYWSENAFIHPTAKIGSNCIIDHNVYIGKNVEIGNHCWIKPNSVVGHGVTIGSNTLIGSNCSLSFTQIGSGCRILAGVRIGQEGFGFAIDPTGHIPVPQLGRVLIGDRVWIGANTTIDRGSGPDTMIGDGCMIDNLVQIGHNVKIGKFAVIVAQVGISGSTEIDDYAVLAGQVGVAGHLKIGRGARIAAQSGVLRDVDPGTEVMGYPAMPIKDFLRQVATLGKLIKKTKEK